MREIGEFADAIADAYSTDNYRGGWRPCIRMLRAQGCSDTEIEALLRSKHTRWAADGSGKPYGRNTSADLARYMRGYAEDYWPEELQELVIGTFGAAAGRK